MMKSDYVVSKGSVWEKNTETWGNLLQVDTSVGDRGCCAAASEPPKLGQHTHEILQTLLGVTPDQLKDWSEKGLI